MNKIIYYFLFTLFAATVFISCDSDSVTPEKGIDENNNGFETLDLAKIFADNCSTSGCHSAENPANGFSTATYTQLMKGSTNRSGGLIPNYGGEDVIPLQEGKSLLYQIITGNVTPQSPHDLITLSDKEKDTIRDWIREGAKDNKGNLPFQNPSYRVYICNQVSDKVSVVDGDSKVVTALLDVDFLIDIADKPHMVKERDGFLYVTLITTGKFLKFSTTDYKLVGDIGNILKAGMIQITPDGNKAFVSRSSTSDPVFNSIFAIDIKNMTVIKEILLPAPGVPHGLALTPDGSTLYVANLSLDRISIVDAVNNEFVEDISFPVGTQPMQTTVSPDGKYLYVSAKGTGNLIVIDTGTKTIVAQVNIGPGPMHISVKSDGSKIYVPSMMGNYVAVVEKNGTTWTKTKQITHPGIHLPHGSDLTADDKYLYISSRNNDGGFTPEFTVTGEGPPGTLCIINTQTDEVIKLIELEEFSAGLTIGN